MKRNDFLKHLKNHNCQLLREGGRHILFINSLNGKQTAVPRHPELSDLLCKVNMQTTGNTLGKITLAQIINVPKRMLSTAFFLCF